VTNTLRALTSGFSLLRIDSRSIADSGAKGKDGVYGALTLHKAKRHAEQTVIATKPESQNIDFAEFYVWGEFRE
jgi:hypothetical protein